MPGPGQLAERRKARRIRQRWHPHCLTHGSDPANAKSPISFGERALENTDRAERGRWILSAERPDLP